MPRTKRESNTKMGSKELETRYLRRKIWLWSVFLLILALLLVILIKPSFNSLKVKDETIRVGICGEVRTPAVYTVIAGSDLAMLIRKAGGTTPYADIDNVPLEMITRNDSIYHIPSRGIDGVGEELDSSVRAVMESNYVDATKEIANDLGSGQIRQINALYVGFPSVFILINYYPDLKRVTLTHIPHSSIFLDNNYRLVDLFFTIGIKPTINILENRLRQKIDYYLIQDRSSFIEMIDWLGGIDINIDKPFAEAYGIKDGQGHLNGHYAWEFVKFLDMRRIHRDITEGSKVDLVRMDNFTAKGEAWQLAYEYRQHRQKLVLEGMKRSYKEAGISRQVEILPEIAKTLETNVDIKLMLELYKDILSTQSYNFAPLPGYYKNDETRLFFYPDIPSYELLRREAIRKLLQDEKVRQTIY